MPFLLALTVGDDGGMRLVNTPEHWVVELLDGSSVDVWADAAEGLAGAADRRDYRFCNLMDVSVGDQEWFDIQGRAASNPERVLVTVTLFSRGAVRAVHGASRA